MKPNVSRGDIEAKPKNLLGPSLRNSVFHVKMAGCQKPSLLTSVLPFYEGNVLYLV